MTADNQTSLRFSLKESVWFQKGQEVAELLSISLDPDIVIHERDYEVVVRGELQLSGEYIPQEDEEAAFSLRELSPVRTVDSVYVREDGVNELSHAFPLEISIPKARVKQVNNLYVTIESFDYEMPERGCLQLLADIEISGLCGQEREQEEVYEEEDQEELYPVVEEEEEELFEPFQLEVRKAPAAEETEKTPQIAEENKEGAFPHVELFSRTKELAEETEKIPQIAEENKEEAFSYAELFSRTKELAEETEKTSQTAEENKEEAFPHAELFGRAKELVEETEKTPQIAEENKGGVFPHAELFGRAKELVEKEGQEEVQEEEEEFEYSARDENALYLTKLFTKEREEEFTKLRIYFVQNGDTVESIAERYETSVQQITRVNQLDDFYLTEGQTLYIPIPKSKSK